MTKQNQDGRLRLILEYYGIRNQILKLAEEATELAHASFRVYKRVDSIGNGFVVGDMMNLAEELADVIVVGKQIADKYEGFLSSCGCTIEEIEERKIQRTLERIDENKS